MKKTIYKYLIILINKSSIMVGGQAVIEGVMMRVPGAYATAVRAPTGKISYKRQEYNPIVEKYKLNNIFIIRGFCHLIDSMKIGYQTLDWSAKIAEEETSKPNKLVDYILTVLSILFAIMLFMGIPYYLTERGLTQQNIIPNNDFIFNLLAGITRISIFILYLFLLSFIKDVKTLFEYHGAEHKTVYNFESGKRINLKNAKTFSTLHPRCGTSFMFIIMIVTILSYSTIDTILTNIFLFNFNIPLRIIMHLLFLPIIAGLGYEVLKFLASNQNNSLFYILSKPGLWLQKITTNEPNDQQLEVAILALEKAFGKKLATYQGKRHIADAIG